MAWDYGQLQLPGFLGDFLQTKSLPVLWRVLAPHPSDGWMDPSQMFDPPTSLGVAGMLPASSRDADGSVGLSPVGGAPGSHQSQGILVCQWGRAVPGAGGWDRRFYTVYVQMQGIKRNGSDCSGLSS